MAKNLKALTDEELAYLQKTYKFELMGDYIAVSCSTATGATYNRKTLHIVSEPFTLSTKVRKITITTQAINLWIDKYKDNYSLMEVQNAINLLIITYQDVTEQNIETQLKRGQAKIETL